MQAVNIAIDIPHILQAIVLACDSPTVAALARTNRWVREVVNADYNNPKLRNVHVAIEDGAIKYLYRRQKNQEPPHDPSAWTDRSFRSNLDADSGGELPNTVIDLVGTAAPKYDDMDAGLIRDLLVKGFIPNVVRLIARLNKIVNWNGSTRYVVGYPSYMPSARSVVAFPYPHDTWNELLHDEVMSLSFSDIVDVQVETGAWVFDRVVFHPDNPDAGSEWAWKSFFGSTFLGTTVPHLPPAWHTVFLIDADTRFDKYNNDLFGRVAHVAAVALQRRKTIPGSHVTVVTNAIMTVGGARRRTLTLEKALRNETKAYLAKAGHLDKFITEVIAAIKCISWDQYKASITPRQFELENIR